MNLRSRHDGYYNDQGRWVKTKHCFTKCRRCTCKPPGGKFIKSGSILDKQIKDNIKETDDDRL